MADKRKPTNMLARAMAQYPEDKELHRTIAKRINKQQVKDAKDAGFRSIWAVNENRSYKERLAKSDEEGSNYSTPSYMSDADSLLNRLNEAALRDSEYKKDVTDAGYKGRLTVDKGYSGYLQEPMYDLKGYEKFKERSQKAKEEGSKVVEQTKRSTKDLKKSTKDTKNAIYEALDEYYKVLELKDKKPTTKD
jgi:hypothetical protein